MIITDTLSNLFSKIKNGYLSNKSKIIQQKSKQSILILNLFIREGFIKSYKYTNDNRNELEIFLKYKNNKPIITEIKRISKPGQRKYIQTKDLYKKTNGTFILSTSKGMLTHLQAKRFNLGGEMVCKIF